MINIDKNLCTGCSNCVNVCPFGAISIVDNKAVVDSSQCRLCGVCINACPVQAISFVRETAQDTQSESESDNMQQFNPFPSGMGFPGSGRGMGRGMGRGRNFSGGMGMGRGMGRKGRR